MITHELAQIWFTSDGKKFLEYENAVKHEALYQKEKELMENLRKQWKTVE